MNRSVSFSLVVAAFVAAVSGSGVAAQEAAAESPLSFMEPFMGPWVPPDDWEAIGQNPALSRLVPLNLQWVPSRQAIQFCEGLPTGVQPETCGLVVWNPATEQAEWLAFQPEFTLVFKGVYELVARDVLRREYDVIYPDGNVVRYREAFTLTAPTTMEWRTHRLEDGEWVRINPTDTFVRPQSEPEDALAVLERLIGEWGVDNADIPDDLRQWRERNNIDDEYVSFRWGTDRQWIEFGEHRRRDGEWRLEGAALIGWNSGQQALTYFEQTHDPLALQGGLVVVDDLTIERHYKGYTASGRPMRWKTTWRWENAEDACFEWTTASLSDGVERAASSYRVCRR